MTRATRTQRAPCVTQVAARAAALAGMEKRMLRRLSFINKRWSVAVTDTAPKEVRHS